MVQDLERVQTSFTGIAAHRLFGANLAYQGQTLSSEGLEVDAVGKMMGSDGGPRSELDTLIVGVVQNAKYSEVKDQIPPLYFRPYRQDPDVGSMSFYVKTSSDPKLVLAALPGIVKRLDPNLPLENVRTLVQQVKDNTFLDRMMSTLSAAFAMLATRWQRSASTVCRPTPSRSARAKSDCGWHSAPRQAACAAWCCRGWPG